MSQAPSPGTSRIHNPPRTYETSPMPSNPQARGDRRRSLEHACRPPLRNPSPPTWMHAVPISAGCSLRHALCFSARRGPSAELPSPLQKNKRADVRPRASLFGRISDYLTRGRRFRRARGLLLPGRFAGRARKGAGRQLYHRLASPEPQPGSWKPQIGAFACSRARRQTGGLTRSRTLYLPITAPGIIPTTTSYPSAISP